MSTTRRISVWELEKLKEMQELLARRGISLSQSQLGTQIIEFVMLHYTAFAEHVAGSSARPLHQLLHEPVTGDEETDSVKEHDVVL